MDKLAMILFTVIISIVAVSYAAYMISALNKNVEVKTPDERTYRLAFFVIIIISITFLGLELKSEIPQDLLAILGTIAGYVLGGVTQPKVARNNSVSEAENK